MSEVLHEGFRVLNPELPAAFRSESLHRLDVLVHSVVCPQPFALRRMAHEHLDFAIDLLTYVDVRRRCDRLPRIGIACFDRIAIV